MIPPAPHEPMGAPPDPPKDFKQRLAKARHDLRNPLAHILGFSEMLIEKAGDDGPDSLKQRFEAIYRTADGLVAEINRCLDLQRVRAEEIEAKTLKNRLRTEAARITSAAEELARQSRTRTPDPFSNDLGIIAGAGRKLSEVTETALEFLIVGRPEGPKQGR